MPVRHDESNGGRAPLRALRARTEYVEVREHGPVHSTAAGVRTWGRDRFAGGGRLDLSPWGRRSHDVGRTIAACRRNGRPVVERDVATS